jgi:hypothetical protein
MLPARFWQPLNLILSTPEGLSLSCPSLSPAPLSLLPLFRRREGLISLYILHRDLCCYPELVEYAGTDEPASRVLRACGTPEDIVYPLGAACLD